MFSQLQSDIVTMHLGCTFDLLYNWQKNKDCENPQSKLFSNNEHVVQNAFPLQRLPLTFMAKVKMIYPHILEFL